MIPATNPVSTLEELVAERKRLQALCRQKEMELNQSLTHLQQNFGDVIIDSFKSSKVVKDNPAMEKIFWLADWVENLLPDDFKENKTFKLIFKIMQLAVGGWVVKKFKGMF